MACHLAKCQQGRNRGRRAKARQPVNTSLKYISNFINVLADVFEAEDRKPASHISYQTNSVRCKNPLDFCSIAILTRSPPSPLLFSCESMNCRDTEPNSPSMIGSVRRFTKLVV